MARSTYSQIGDLLKGDIPLAPQYGDGTKMVEMAADDIDAQLGHIYTTPFEIENLPVNRPSILLLKKINNLIASGRLICDIALSSENQQLNAYGASLYNEGVMLLNKIASGEIDIVGSTFLPSDGGDDGKSTGPRVNNEDSYSLVESFYRRTSGRPGAGAYRAEPYGGNTETELDPEYYPQYIDGGTP